MDRKSQFFRLSGPLGNHNRFLLLKRRFFNCMRLPFFVSNRTPASSILVSDCKRSDLRSDTRRLGPSDFRIENSSSCSQSHCVKKHIPRQLDSSAIGTSPRRQTRGSQSGLGRLGPTRNAAHSARLYAAQDHNNTAVRSRRLLESLHAQQMRFPHRKTVSISEVHN